MSAGLPNLEMLFGRPSDELGQESLTTDPLTFLWVNRDSPESWEALRKLMLAWEEKNRPVRFTHSEQIGGGAAPLVTIRWAR